MKIKNILFYTALTLSGYLSSQEDQTAKATKMGDGPFMSYVISESGGNYTYAGINKEVCTFSFKPYQGDFKEIVVQEAEKKPNSYYPDEEAFPVTYVWGYYNTEACMRGWDYIERRDENRMVILDEWVYILEKWENKDNYRIQKCFKKGELSGFKLTKKAFGAAKEMEKANHKETLQKYLDEAFKKQSELLPAWKANNQAKIDKQKAAKDRYRFTIDSVNGKYWNSEQGKKKLAEMRKSPVYIYNDTNTEFLMCHGQGVSTLLKPGEKKEFSCAGGGRVYRGKRRPGNNTTQWDSTGQLLLDLNGNNCGMTYNASSFK
ncbi:MAG: hypothetical protein IT236_01250 [Bacteroidia bacterium]|nr:hypothetical protein [Bacteroidia bacterium]